MTEVYESYSELKVNGRELLLVDNDGYTYKKARGNSGAKLSYACSENAEGSCECKIQVLNDKVVWRTTAHSHMPNEFSLQAKVTLSRLWHAATESDCDIRELVTNTMPLLSPNVVLYMPEAERLKVSLQASRRAAAKKRAGEPAPKRKPAAGKKRKAELVDKENLAKLENNADEKDEPPAEDLTCFDSLQEQLEGLQSKKDELNKENSPEEHLHIKRTLFPEDAPPAVKKLKMMKVVADSDSE